MGEDEAFDLGIFDEAHKTAGRVGVRFAFAVADQNLLIRKRLFLTATPRHYNYRKKDKEGDAKLVYLRSRFCMYELVQIYRKDDFRKRIFPVVLPDVTGLSPMQRLKIVKFWGEQRDQHQQEFALNLGDISPEGFADFYRVRQIAQNCDAALSHIFGMNYLNQAQLAANDFRLLRQAIGERMEEPSAQAGRL